MSFCIKCGKELNEGDAFCIACGNPVSENAAFSSVVVNKEEQDFLDTTHRLLRWEYKAWSIAGKAFTIFGIVFGAIFLLIGLIGMGISADGNDFGGGIALSVIGFVYAIILGGMFIALGIINNIAAKKIPQYLDTLYSDFRLTYDRCGSVGMLIFNVFFGAISPIFFIINFVRMKANRQIIERIIANQNPQN